MSKRPPQAHLVGLFSIGQSYLHFKIFLNCRLFEVKSISEIGMIVKGEEAPFSDANLIIRFIFNGAVE